MKQQLLLVVFGLALLQRVTNAQIRCGGNFFVNDDKTHTCEMKRNDKCNKVMIIVTGFPRAQGYGGCIATPLVGREKTPSVYCCIQTKKGTSTLKCREKDREMYQLDLGNSLGVESVMIAVSRRTVRVTVNKLSLKSASSNKNPSYSKKIPYVINAVFPIDETVGFCSGKEINYVANGYLGKTKTNKKGKGKKTKNSGYIVSAYQVPF